MTEASNIELTERQREILRRVVEEYVEQGQPVGSKNLVARAGMTVSPSTVRGDLAELERRGLLTHPHTSAGRVPTETGYRLYAESLLARLEPRPSPFPLDLAAARSELEAALQETTETLSQATRLLALVSAPALETATVRHVEVLVLQPQVLMVVVITSTGGVSKRVFALAEPVDTGLALWAGEYLNERLTGLELGSATLRRRFEDPSLARSELEVLELLRPAFTELAGGLEQQLFVGGAASLLSEVRSDELEACQRLLETLEKRAAILELLGETLGTRRPYVRVGGELDNPALREVSLVGASYGLANRTLGAVSLLGPLRMDYEKAIRSVRAAAHELSRFVESVYEDD
ncbi:MAG TPA: heat-inducible transcriptional repressor HrcA [Gaiellaceae bacterium]|nr:heat-inducible transcriptional repressor HrcA [Gaiellaceae bacterium]